MKLKKFTSVFLVILMIVQLCSAVVYADDENTIMQKTRVYENSCFKDIYLSDWYYNDVISAYEYGVMSGVGNNTFNPLGNMKICEAITIAAKVNSMAYSRELPTYDSETWYDPYIKYVEGNGIISKGKFWGKYEQNITRAEFMYILYNSLESADLKNANPYISKIYDMNKSESYYNEILSAMRAGIISGKDSNGSFCPNDNITRAEASSVLTRLIDKSKRKSQLREVLNRRKENQSYDFTEYYNENKNIINYGNFNNITSISRIYYPSDSIAEYCYMYEKEQFDLYINELKKQNMVVSNKMESNLAQQYTCKIGKTSLYITIFEFFDKIVFEFMSDDTFEFSKEEWVQNSVSKERASWEKSEHYLENSTVKNFGYAFDWLDCIKREKFYDASGTKMRYVYNTCCPFNLNNYTGLLEQAGFVVNRHSVNSNDLFFEFCFSKHQNPQAVRIFVNLDDYTTTIEFFKTNASDIDTL